MGHVSLMTLTSIVFFIKKTATAEMPLEFLFIIKSENMVTENK
jgi:hypothetical protein